MLIRLKVRPETFPTGLPMPSWRVFLQHLKDKRVEGMLSPQVIEDTVDIMLEAIKKEKKMVIIIKKRAGGNGPLTAQQIVKRFLDLHG